MMPINDIDDWEERLARQDAFWEGAVLDRPPCMIRVPHRSAQATPKPARIYASQRERWMDTQRVVDQALAFVRSTAFLGDALPEVWPNLGPEVFSAFFGLELEYSPETSWAVPIIDNWSNVDHVRFSKENFYWKKLLETTDALLEAGKGLFYVGITDLHPGGDALAAFREPILLNTDLLLEPEPVKRMLERVTQVFFEVIDFYFDRLEAAGQAVAAWPGIVSSKRWYVPSNDFSCMISEALFNEFFVPGIGEECRHLEAAIYHLDGPGALRHLDALLAIEELNAIQWVYGAGNGRSTDWIPVYRHCQDAGKGIQLDIAPDELDEIMENLRPEGVHMTVHGVQDEATAQRVLSRIGKWT